VNNHTQTNPVLQAALDYSRLGLPVFPCRPDKTPYTPNGFKNATTDEKTIRGWWNLYPDLLIGMPTGKSSGVSVLDIDGAEGEAGLATLLANNNMPDAPCVRTGRGGRHYWFSHRDGIKNSQSTIAPGIDVRGEGGYVILPPSSSKHGAYSWIRKFSDKLAELPNFPDWLKPAPSQPALPVGHNATIISPDDQIKRCRAYLGKMSGAISGQRGHDRTLEAAATCFRFGLSKDQAWPLILEFNSRCSPPWTEKELGHKLEDAERKVRESGEFGKFLNEPTWQPSPSALAEKTTGVLPELCEAADIADDENSELGPPVIDGYLRQSETMNLIAAPKLGKSFLSYGLALSVALGQPWLGQFPCPPRKVLILDNELHKRTLRHRIKQVCRAMNIDPEALRGRLFFDIFRGRLVRFNELTPYFTSLADHGFSLIICDAYYRFFAGDENSNSETATAYNLLDQFAALTGAAIVLIHHQSKGDQSGKSVTDVGAGAGSQSRAADTHAVMREHEEPGKVVLEAKCRTWRTPLAITLEYDYPLWKARPDIVPVLKTLRKRRVRDETEKPSYETAAELALDEPKPLVYFTAKMRLGATKTRQLLAEAVECGLIHAWPPATKNEPARWANKSPPLTQEGCSHAPYIHPKCAGTHLGAEVLAGASTRKKTENEKEKP